MIFSTNAAQRKAKSRMQSHFLAHAKLKPMAGKFTIGLVQMKCTTNAEENLARAMEKICEAAGRGAQIICLHELFRGEYFCRTEDAELFNLAEPVPGPTTEGLAQVAKEKKVALVVSLFERRAPGVYHNTCAVLDADGSFLGKYRKMHIPDDPLYYEKFYFTPGDLGFPNFNTKYARIGVQICTSGTLRAHVSQRLVALR